MSSLNPPSELRRHALVWLKQAPKLDSETDAADIERWHDRGYPWVACRHRGGADQVSLGFCVASPDSPIRRRRISLQAPHEHVLRIERPPSLAFIAEKGSSGILTRSLSELSTRALAEGLHIHVFGSWMWQALTGDSYVSATSDLDVLIEVANQTEADRAATFLQSQETGYPIKIDGELSFPRQGEVHWREYLSDAHEILLKSITTVRLTPREDLWK